MALLSHVSFNGCECPLWFLNEIRRVGTGCGEGSDLQSSSKNHRIPQPANFWRREFDIQMMHNGGELDNV